MTATNWAAGWNMPGYLPETDPYITDDWEGARDYLMEEIDREAEIAAEPGLGGAEDPASLLSEADSTWENLRDFAGPAEWSGTVGNCAYWISATDQPIPEEARMIRYDLNQSTYVTRLGRRAQPDEEIVMGPCRVLISDFEGPAGRAEPVLFVLFDEPDGHRYRVSRHFIDRSGDLDAERAQAAAYDFWRSEA
jgi:hypothetical protein